MKKNEPITTIMTDQVITVHQGKAVSEARKLMVEHGIHHIPVVSGDTLTGMISANDMLKISFNAYGADQRAVDAYLDAQFSIDDVMTKDLDTLSEKSMIRDAAAILAKASYHSLPVVDADGNLKGIVTSTDLIKYLNDQF